MAKKKLATTTLKKKRENAQKVAESIRIQSVRLIEVDCHRQLQDGPLPQKTEVTCEVELTYSKELGRLTVVPNFSLVATHDGKGESPPLRIRAKFHLDYRIAAATSISERDVFAFAEVTGAFNAWPYWRELVQSMTTRMGLPSLTLPLLTLSGGKSPESKATTKRKKKATKKRVTKKRVKAAKKPVKNRKKKATSRRK